MGEPKPDGGRLLSWLRGLRRGPRRLWVGPLIALLSLAVCVTGLELMLRFAGWAYALQRSGSPALSYKASSREDKDNINILALGDSFTFGGHGQSGKTYPSVLSRLLNRPGGGVRYEVVNSGICESTSRHVRDAFDEAMYLNHPDVVILLTGAANRFDPVPYTAEFESLSAGIWRWILHLRVYKLLRPIFWKARDFAPEARLHPWQEDLTMEDRFIATKSRAALLAMRSRLEAATGDASLPNRAGALVTLGYVRAQLGQPVEAEAAMRQAMALLPPRRGDAETGPKIPGPGAGRARLRAAYFFHVIAPGLTEDRAEKLRYLFEAAKLEPRLYGSVYFYQALLRLQPLQSVYDSAAVLRELGSAVEAYPALGRDPLLRAYTRVFQHQKTFDEHRDEWLRRDLEDIVAKAAAHQVRLVLQTYPLSYTANAVIRSVANVHSLPLVDNEPVFKALIEKNRGRKPFIQDGDHCTDLGHEIMAREVRQILGAQVLGDADGLRWHGGWQKIPRPGDRAHGP